MNSILIDVLGRGCSEKLWAICKYPATIFNYFGSILCVTQHPAFLAHISLGHGRLIFSMADRPMHISGTTGLTKMVHLSKFEEF